MNHSLSRRRFLQSCGISVTGLAFAQIPGLAIEPFQRQGPPRLQLSLAAYSFRDFFVDGRSRSAAAQSEHRIDMFQFVDFCADHGCAGAELTSYYFPAAVTEEYLLKLRRHAFLRGIAISGSAVGNTFTLPPGAKRDAEIASVKKWIDHAAVLGAPHIRVFAGAAQGGSKQEAKSRCLAALEECADYAGKHGIFLGIENHGGIVAEPEDLLDIIRDVKSPWVGINLDTGNFHTDDPYRDVARCAPYAVNVQVKAEVHPRGQAVQPADLARLAGILRDARYQGYVALEYESAEDPWKAVPRLLQQMKGIFEA